MSRPEQLSIVEFIAIAGKALEDNDFQRAQSYYRLAVNQMCDLTKWAIEQMQMVARMELKKATEDKNP